MNSRIRTHLIRGLILVIVVIAAFWWSGPRRVSRVVPKDAILCQILYTDISDHTVEDISRKSTFQGDELDALLDFLDHYELEPIWDFGPNTPGSRHYTLVFYGETALLSEIRISSEGIVKIGNRKYQFSNWTTEVSNTFDHILRRDTSSVP